MIPKAELLAIAEEVSLLPTTVEKDYVLGWMLFGIAQDAELSQWIFKGGTCLKKCFFDTYRFSEDLDFTLPGDASAYGDVLRGGLARVAAWVQQSVGIEVPGDGFTVEDLVNRKGQRTCQVRMTFVGPLQLAPARRQRLKFDLTRDELVVESPELRPVFHGYSDAPDPSPRVRCYTLTEVLAEKARALHEREGRARDVYDVVSVGRNLRDEIVPERVRDAARRKFAFKGLADPEPGAILARVNPDVLATDWEQALRHQLAVLPPVDEFLKALAETLEWLFVPARRVEVLSSVPAPAGEAPVPVLRFATPTAALGLGARVAAAPREAYGSRMDRVRYAARNRLLARITYHGVPRLVEPYSLRMPKSGNLLLYVYEVQRGSGAGGGIKAYKVAELADVQVTEQAFRAKYMVEL